jgi:predicted dehydrogenase
MIRIAVVGLGKMGISHLGIVRPHKSVEVVAVCDATGYILDVLSKYTGLNTFTDYDKMLAEAKPDAVIIATPSRLHVDFVKSALEKGIHVFCEKPFTLDPADSAMLAELAVANNLVNQVGYHYRFVGAFQEVKRLLDAGAIGEVSHVLAEAYGPVVLKPKGSTWRTQRSEGGGCLYDYAAHPINLLNWYFGMPEAVGGSVLGKVFSRDTDDEVFSTLYYPGGKSAQLSVSWSDESQRKMSTKLTIWGTAGRIYADRQEVQVYARDTATLPDGYNPGWNVRYTTDLTEEVDFYIRGEEYSAQIDYFVRAILEKRGENVNDFVSAAQTDHIIGMMIADADNGPRSGADEPISRAAAPRKRFSLFGR